MYETLIRWGLETIREVAGDISKEEFTLTLEAVKTKNALVQRRFEYAKEACESLIGLAMRVDQEVRELQHKSANKPLSLFLGGIRNDHHPNYLREYRKLRGKFIVTNDLLAAYSLLTAEFIQYRQFRYLAEKHQYDKIADAASLYRAMWEHVVFLLSSLVRISSNDLRFWLTDRPYVRTAEQFACKELEFARGFFESNAKNEYYGCLLETEHNLNCFWRNAVGEVEDTYMQPSKTTTAIRSVISRAAKAR